MKSCGFDLVSETGSDSWVEAPGPCSRRCCESALCSVDHPSLSSKEPSGTSWIRALLGEHATRKDDPLYRSRRLLAKGHERLDEPGETKLLSLLESGDPLAEVRMTWHAKETIRGIYDIDDPDTRRRLPRRAHRRHARHRDATRGPLARPDTHTLAGPHHRLT
jgi:hypothetical protein